MNKISYSFDTYIIEFPIELKYKIFDDVYCYGIWFFYSGGRTEVIHNRDAKWNRILITRDGDEWCDIPFKKEAFWTLPNNVNVFDMNDGEWL